MANQYSRTSPYKGIVDIDDTISLDPDLFNDFIFKVGIRAKIEKATVCPNYVANVKSNHHAPNCQLCRNGFISYGETYIWVAFMQNQLQKLYLERGEFSAGQAILVVPSIDESGNEFYLGLYDKITLIDQAERFYELLNKSPTDTDLLRYQAVDIEFVTTASRGVDNPFIRNEDYELDPNGNLHWIIGGQRPIWDAAKGIGEAITVSYVFRPVYRVLQFAHEGRYSGKVVSAKQKTTTRFPQTVIARKDYYIAKEDIDGILMKPPVNDQRDSARRDADTTAEDY